MKRISLFSLAVLCAVGALPQRAEAGGLFLTDRGTRPLGRGFAFVAGADDPQAIWYNPAGLAFSGQQLLLDATVTFLRADFTRIDSGGNVLPTVSVDAAKLPIPMLAYSHPLREDLVMGFGLFAPNASLLRWPRGVRADGGSCDATGEPMADCEAAPQRYSLYSLEGSAFVNITAAVAYKPIPELSIGAGVYVLLGRFVGETAISACDGFVCTQAENPEYDGVARFDLNPIVHPGFTLGATYDADIVRVGASMVWWPSAVSGDAKLNVRLPSAPLFDGARVEGDSARLELDLPLMVRAGVEVRPLRQLRVEAAFVWEHWSTQDAAHIQPNDIWIRDAVAIGDYQVGDIDIPRNMNDVYSLRLGAELDAVEDLLTVSVGINYENSSFDDAYLTPLTLDSRKVVVALGASVQVVEGLFLDVSYGHVFMADPQVRNSQVPQPNPIRPPRSTDVPASAGGAAFVGNGDYNMEADMVGVGLRWQVDAAAPAAAGEGETDAEADEDSSAAPDEEDGAWYEGSGDEPESGGDGDGDSPDEAGDAGEEAEGASPWYRRD